MAVFETNAFVAAGQAAQAEVVNGLDARPNLLIARYFDPDRPEAYRPTGSYAAQLRNHGARIGVDTSQIVIQPGNEREMMDAVNRHIDDERTTAFMPLYPLPEDVRETIFGLLGDRPELDADDLLRKELSAPTARSMLACGNLCLHGSVELGGADYFTGKTLDELDALDLPEGLTVDNLRFGGRGQLTNGPLIRMLDKLGIKVPDEYVATFSKPEPLNELPEPALVFTATPTAEQIRDNNIPDGSVMIDAGFGIRNGITYGNTERSVIDRKDVLWTPPVRGVGPGSTLYFYHNMFRLMNIPPEQMPALGEVAMAGLAKQ